MQIENNRGISEMPKQDQNIIVRIKRSIRDFFNSDYLGQSFTEEQIRNIGEKPNPTPHEAGYPRRSDGNKKIKND